MKGGKNKIGTLFQKGKGGKGRGISNWDAGYQLGYQNGWARRHEVQQRWDEDDEWWCNGLPPRASMPRASPPTGRRDWTSPIASAPRGRSSRRRSASAATATIRVPECLPPCPSSTPSRSCSPQPAPRTLHFSSPEGCAYLNTMSYARVTRSLNVCNDGKQVCAHTQP